MARSQSATTRSPAGAVEAALQERPALVGDIAMAHQRLVSLGLADSGWTLVQVPADAIRHASAALIADLAALSHRGISLGASAALVGAPGGVVDVSAVLRAMWEATEHNPMPEAEWAPMRATMTDELLASLLGISLQSIRRYASAERDTPDDVATRLHFIALVNADLAGSYNDRGIRRWWGRPRATLGNQSPLAALGEGFDPDGATAAQVRALSATLLGAGAVS